MFHKLISRLRLNCPPNGSAGRQRSAEKKNRRYKCLLLLSLAFSTILVIATYSARHNLKFPPSSNLNYYVQNLNDEDLVTVGITVNGNGNGNGGSDLLKNSQFTQNKLLSSLDPDPSVFHVTRDLWSPARPLAHALQTTSDQGRGRMSDFDFNEFVDDRIFLQRSWIQNFTKTKTFTELKPKKILVLDGYYSYFGHSGDLNCPADRETDDGSPNSANSWASKCILVEDNWWTGFFRNFEEFHAVIGVRNWVYRIYEGKLPSWVKQILFTVESPFVTRYADFSVNNAMLASYWRGSDISMPYGKYVPFQNQNTNQTFGVNSKNRSRNRNYAQGKTKLAAIVVSDCTPENDRLGYVHELQRHVSVDVFGKCGTLVCDEPCFPNLQKQYKFYLAFENANCRDYITEKFFRNALLHDMVPVVLGAPKKDYIYAAPPSSFIHIEDFDSPSKLAKFLEHLDQDDDSYNEYFRWKSLGSIIDPSSDFFCRSCALLFIADLFPPPDSWPKGSTWKQLNYCLPRGRWYWNRTQ